MKRTLFEGLNTGEISGLREILTLNQQTYPANTIIPFPDLKSNTIGIINTGLVELKSSDADGHEIILSYYKKDDSFGPYSVDSLDLIPEEFSDRGGYFFAKKSSDITYLNYEELLTDRPKYQETCKKIIQNLIRIRLMNNQTRILVLSRRSIRDRFMTYLEILRSENERMSDERLLQGHTFSYGETTTSLNRPVAVALPLSYTDLAAYLIADRSSLMREIKNMKEEGLIAEENQKLRLLWKED